MTLTQPKSLKTLAERKRFELSIGFPLYTLSRGAPSIRKGHEIKANARVFVTNGDDSTQHMTGTDTQKRWSGSIGCNGRQVGNANVIKNGLRFAKKSLV